MHLLTVHYTLLRRQFNCLCEFSSVLFVHIDISQLGCVYDFHSLNTHRSEVQCSRVSLGRVCLLVDAFPQN